MKSMLDYVTEINEAVNTNPLSIKDIKKLTQKHNYPFKTLICLSKKEHEKRGETETINIYMKTVCEVNNMKYINFDCETVKYDINKNSFKISDANNEITLTDDDKKTTVIFSRKLSKDNEYSKKLSTELNKHGFIVTSTAEKSHILRDKFETYKLLEKHKIPQSRTKLIKKSDIKKNNFDINKFLEDIYPEIKTNSEEENKKLKYVIKIPNGACGQGIFSTIGDNIFGLLQTIFEIQPEQELLIQRFEKLKGGDIRTYVLTYNGKQEIIGAIKRLKPKTDFRSNISLGAKSEAVKLTKEQEEIALNAAKVSGITLCGVDIMPIEKNIDGYENIVVECNSSPENGKGIDDKLGTNLVNLVLNALETKI